MVFVRAGERLEITTAKFYIINTGKGIIKLEFPDGKIATSEYMYNKNEYIFNYFFFDEENKFITNKINFIYEAIEDTYLKTGKIDNLKKNKYMYPLLERLARIALSKAFKVVCDTPAYILNYLKTYSDEYNEVSKKEFNYNNFNISKSQFYKGLKYLKLKNYIYDCGDRYCLNEEKVEEYLRNFALDKNEEGELLKIVS